jgi:hypothetical protein
MQRVSLMTENLPRPSMKNLSRLQNVDMLASLQGVLKPRPTHRSIAYSIIEEPAFAAPKNQKLVAWTAGVVAEWKCFVDEFHMSRENYCSIKSNTVLIQNFVLQTLCRSAWKLLHHEDFTAQEVRKPDWEVVLENPMLSWTNGTMSIGLSGDLIRCRHGISIWNQAKRTIYIVRCKADHCISSQKS